MYTDFRSLLSAATGQSELVIVANADIRGFSRFSLERESVEAALLIKKVYMALLSEYFSYVDFFKPTGDGLLMVFRFDESSLAERSNRVIADGLRLVKEFRGLFRDDPIINFPVPTDIGIGVARGAASRLVSGRKTLDYSGRVLNLASRLMDVARPAGIVVDETFRIELLEESLREEFRPDSVFLRSVADRTPMGIHYTHRHTEILPTARRPIDEPEWKEQTIVELLKEIVEMDGPQFQFPLDQRPIDPSRVSFEAWHPSVMRNGRRHPTMLSSATISCRYVEEAGQPMLLWDTRDLSQRLQARGVKANWPIRLIASYSV